MRAQEPWTRGHVEAEPHVLEILEREPVVASWITAHGAYGWPLTPPFETLVRSIVSQSVSNASAAAVLARVRAATSLEVEGVLGAPLDSLRQAGLSWSKVHALRGAAQFAQAGELEGVARLADEEVVTHLTQLKGVGTWTAEMFLLFCLGRLDVWPVGDLAVRQQIERGYGVSGRSEVHAVGERFRPFRSAVAWYAWRASGGA